MLELDKIHLGDCLELMPSIPSKSVDMILCDLPYGTTDCKWDSIIDMGSLWAQYERVIKDNGAIVLTANAKFTIVLGASNIRLFRYKWVWYKSLKLRFLLANKMPLTQHEDILVFYKNQPTYNPQKIFKGVSSKKKSELRKGDRYVGFRSMPDIWVTPSDYLYPSDVLEIDNGNSKSLHPTQKPVALFEYLIKTYTNEGEIVLDNCSGSGTTAIACLNSNRHFICIEKDEGYHKESLDRIADHEPLLRLI